MMATEKMVSFNKQLLLSARKTQNHGPEEPIKQLHPMLFEVGTYESIDEKMLHDEEVVVSSF